MGATLGRVLCHERKGKKGKKGKNKGKCSSKHGEGDGGKDHFANTASETPQPSSSTTHQTFFAMNADYDFFRDFESKEDLHVPHDPCVQSFMSVPEDEFSYLTHALTPTSMVLDLGCTRAMASKRAAQGLMEFCDAHPDCGLWYRLDQTTSQFTFANSESASCKQKILVCMYDRDYAIQSTEFDIVEQGEVPILMSLTQMRNLRFHFDLHPDKVYLSRPVLGIKNMVLKVARSTHLILDLLDVCHHMRNVKFEKHKKVSFFTNGIHFEYGNIAKSEEALAVNDEWILDEEKMELIRLHRRDRHETYLPTASPIPDEYLDSTRKTIYEFTNRKLTKEDQWKTSVGKKQPVTKGAWKGRTIFKILPGGLENRTSVKVRSASAGPRRRGKPNEVMAPLAPRGEPSKGSGRGSLEPVPRVEKKLSENPGGSKGSGIYRPVPEEPERVERPAPPEGEEDEDDTFRGIERLFEPYEHEEAAEEPQPAPARAPQLAEPAGSEALEPRRIALPLPGSRSFTSVSCLSTNVGKTAQRCGALQVAREALPHESCTVS